MSRRCAGFSLLETLIALLVLSIGALGNVALQLHALQATHSAYQRTLASLIAADAGERLWQSAAGGDTGLGWLDDWVQRRDCAQADPHVCLPELEVRISGGGTGRVISVSWAEERFADAEHGRVQLDYAIQVPQEPTS
ncbi:MAG: type IV pilus modification protein PilV [Thioalkalivibrio sp.]|nr:type IV pilus modification protein PilV [Thioalkalivibrio sp.]